MEDVELKTYGTFVLNEIAENLAWLNRSATETNLLDNYKVLKSFVLIPQNQLSCYDKECVVLIDEIETHLQ